MQIDEAASTVTINRARAHLQVRFVAPRA